MTFDAAVVGAGPAGAAAALTLARAGTSVVLLDRGTSPRWKVCGGCVAPGAMGLLDELEVAPTVRGRGARPLHGMELRAGSGRARLRLRDGASAISRAALDDALVQAAVRAGARLRPGCRVDGVRIGADAVRLMTREDATGAREETRARVVVDATGLGALATHAEDGAGQAGVRESAAPRIEVGATARGSVGPLRDEVDRTSRIGLGAVYAAGWHDTDGCRLEDGAIRMVVGRSGYVGMVEIEDGRLNVAAAVDPDAVAADGPAGAVSRILDEAGCRLPGAAPELGWRGTPALTRSTRPVAGHRLFRVGDAAGYVEPFTGEGIGWAVGCGVRVGVDVRRALAGEVAGAAESWVRRHRTLVGRRQRACRLLARALRRPALVRGAVAVLGVAPRLADPLVRTVARPVEAGPA